MLQGLRVYIAGPMRGLPDWNAEAFDRAAARLHRAVAIPLSPAALTRALNYEPDERAATPEGHARHLRHVILADVACVLHCDALALLRGWERSVGSTVEVALAQFLGLPMYDAVTLEPVCPPAVPWSQLWESTVEPPAEDGWQDLWRTIGLDRRTARTAQEIMDVVGRAGGAVVVPAHGPRVPVWCPRHGAPNLAPPGRCIPCEQAGSRSYPCNLSEDEPCT